MGYLNVKLLSRSTNVRLNLFEAVILSQTSNNTYCIFSAMTKLLKCDMENMVRRNVSILMTTRMHSSRMHTIHCSGPLSCHARPCHACPHHTCPPATHAPLATHTPCHAHPLPHMRSYHAYPAMHTSPSCTPPATHTPGHTHPLACMHPTHAPQHAPPPREQNHKCL